MHHPFEKLRFLDTEPTMSDICDSENILEAWAKVCENNGCAGVDSVTVEMFAQNAQGNLIGIQEDLLTSAYRPSSLLRFYVNKGGDKPRAISVPTVRDRVVQQAIAAVLTPKLDATFEACSFGYRKGKGRKQAIEEIVRLRDAGYAYVVDADIDDYFDNVDHWMLIQRVADLVPEESVARLIAMFLTCTVDDGGRQITPGKGLPQGSPLSPLLSNLYLDLFDKVMCEQRHPLIRYVDDFVILAREKASAYAALQLAEYLLAQLKLRLKAEKTQITTFQGGFRYLGVLFQDADIFTTGKDNLKLAPPTSPSLPTGNAKEQSGLAPLPPTLRETAPGYRDEAFEQGEQTSDPFDQRPATVLPFEEGGRTRLENLEGMDPDRSGQRSAAQPAPIHRGDQALPSRSGALQSQPTVHPNVLGETAPDPSVGRGEEGEGTTPLRARLAPTPLLQQLNAMEASIQQLRDEIRNQNGGTPSGETPITVRSQDGRIGASRLLSTLYLHEQGSTLSVSEKRFLVKMERQTLLEVPAMKIAQILIFGNAHVTTPAVRFCLKAGIPICFLSQNGSYYGRLAPPTANQVLLQQRQFLINSDLQASLKLAKSFVEGKIHNQRILLQRRQRKIQSAELPIAIDALAEMMIKFPQSTTLDELRGYEGNASARYFNVFGSLLDDAFSFSKRIKHPPTDPVNAMLSFGYTLLFMNIFSLVEAHNLNPYCGHLHALRDGHPALISDLIEEFRALIVDSMVIYLINSRIIKPGDFESKDNAASIRLTPEARKTFVQQFEAKMQSFVTHPDTGYTVDYRRCIDLQITQLVQCLRGERESYIPMKGKA